MSDLFQIISTIISGIAMLIAVISFRQKKTDKDNDISRDIAVIKQDLYASKLGDRISKLEIEAGVIEERVDNEIRELDKLDAKLDEIREKLWEDN